MGNPSENKSDKRGRFSGKHVCLGILAHVDAGKTTLSESILYSCGAIRKFGRVDHGDTFLDTNGLERERGITIFSKQAVFDLEDLRVTLMDTPGHVDFSAEMERTLQVLDYAVLVISGSDGVQSHTRTLWKLLKRYQVPVFLFINKMDQPDTDEERLMEELKKYLDENCLDFSADRSREEWKEQLAMCEEALLDHYLETGQVKEDAIPRLIRERKLYPCFFGSALKRTGVEEFLRGLARYIQPPQYPRGPFGAKIYKISRDPQGNRLTHMKITGGSLKVKTILTNRQSFNPSEGEEDKEKLSGTTGIQDAKRLSGTTGIQDAKKLSGMTGIQDAKKLSGATGIQDAKKLSGMTGIQDAKKLSGTTGIQDAKKLSGMTGIQDAKKLSGMTGIQDVKDLSDRRESQGSETAVEEEFWEEKADQLRIYSGEKYELVNEVEAGEICAVTGLTATYPGQGLGAERASALPILEPVLTYQILPPEGCDNHQLLQKLRQLEEEEPLLHIIWKEEVEEIHAQVMGEIQIEILKRLIQDRFGIKAEFGSGSIVYKETVTAPVEGVGHFEPLRHYAEVHLLLEPLEPGSGLQLDTVCSEDVLDRNWQRLILTHLREREHRGVLTGSPITDMRITLVAGRAHLKHTEGGDFRQATYRAVRQGLQKAQCRLLEPYYEFRLEIPAELVGRGMSDIQRMCGEVQPPQIEGTGAVLTGSAPVVTMRDYQREVTAYTRGMGRLFCSMKGYFPCHNQEEVIQAIGYDPENDLDNPSGSVFCAHGAGFIVPWDQVEAYMHVDSGLRLQTPPKPPKEKAVVGTWKERQASVQAAEKELEEIFVRTYGPIKPRVGEDDRPQRGVKGWKRSHREPAEDAFGRGSAAASGGRRRTKPVSSEKEYLLVDGYNIIFAWDELNALAEANIDSARDRLMDILCNYQGFRMCTVILVFDAYKVKGNPGSVQQYHNIYVVYTKEAETADQYIEKAVHEIGKKYRVTVATSDRLEQVIILGQGANRISAREFREEVQEAAEQIRQELEARQRSGRQYLLDVLDRESAEYMEAVRLGKKTIE